MNNVTRIYEFDYNYKGKLKALEIKATSLEEAMAILSAQQHASYFGRSEPLTNHSKSSI